MKDIAQVLVQIVQPNMFRESTHVQQDIRGWIATQDFGISANIGASNFELDVNDWSQVERALGVESNRFGVGAIESVNGIRRDPDLPKALAWQIVRSYYAAFYSAHTLMRLFGYSLTHLPSSHANKVFQVADLLGHCGTATKVRDGFYFAEFSEFSRTAKFVRVEDSHADTWSSFLKVTHAIEQKVNVTVALNSHKMKTVSFISDLNAGLTHKGHHRGNWLSRIRNNVNYRFTNDAWFPYGNPGIAPDLPESRAANWDKLDRQLTYHRKLPDLKIFFETCFALVTTCQALLRAVVGRIPKYPPYLSHGVVHLLNNLQVAPKL